jgi:hypothetical protein
LFDIWTDQTTLDGNDTNAKTISVLFTFTSPANQNGTITGQTFGVNGTINDGQVTWNALTNPISLNFGATTLSILLDPATFNAKADTTDTDHEHDVRACSNCLNGGQEYDADVVAHFTQTVTPGGVPEPASWALMIGGFGMTGAALRRRRTAVAATA